MYQTNTNKIFLFCLLLTLICFLGNNQIQSFGQDVLQTNKLKTMDNKFLFENLTVPKEGLHPDEREILPTLMDIFRVVVSEVNLCDMMPKIRPILTKIWSVGAKFDIELSVGYTRENQIEHILIATAAKESVCIMKIDTETNKIVFLTTSIFNKNDNTYENVSFYFYPNGQLKQVEHSKDSHFIGHRVKWNENGKIVLEETLRSPEKIPPFFKVVNPDKK